MPLPAGGEPGEDRVHVDGVEIDHAGGLRHGAQDLEEAPHPGIGQVDLVLAVLLRAGGLHREAGGVDGELGVAVAADLLELVVQSVAVIDVGGAEGHLAHAFEHVMVAGEAPVGGFVEAETLEEDLVGMHGDDRVEDDPGVEILLVEAVEIKLPRLVERPHHRLGLDADVREFAAQGLDLGLQLVPPGQRLGEKLLLVGLQPGEIGAAVFRLEAQVRHHDVVQGRDRLAERQVAGDPSVEEGRRAQGIGREAEPRRAPFRDGAALAEIAVDDVHRAASDTDPAACRAADGRRTRGVSRSG